MNSGDKIGLIGRTESGDSSVAMAFFRIHEVTQIHIIVDGIDIRLLPARDLRRRFNISQSPVVYSVRSYLDPFDEFGDATLWTVLASTPTAPTS
ncbi:TPA: hypothetical protein N0F65_003241 [Lagenidium giganteum]|uniref:Uncharacterized protein n=1 Tax=Lagenidium giganteum TaxID=4803 RepID=A0AAV2Z7U6_9STRA|nr:TPA: hypothetical protein N0F65_003241 [Lagenidium giganteum]